MPWDLIKGIYSEKFPVSSGNRAYPSRLAYGALFLKQTLDTSDQGLVKHIQENPYLQYFLGFEGFCHEPPFDDSTMTLFKQRFTPVETAVSQESAGTLILDATCIPADVHFPTDTRLLYEAIDSAMGLTRAWRGRLTKAKEKLLAQAKQAHLAISKSKHPGKARIRSSRRVLLSILNRCLDFC